MENKHTNTFRPTHRFDGWPTRYDTAYWSQVEWTIHRAMEEVELAGASIALTDAVTFLSKAKERVADHMEGNTGFNKTVSPYKTCAEEQEELNKVKAELNTLRGATNVFFDELSQLDQNNITLSMMKLVVSIANFRKVTREN